MNKLIKTLVIKINNWNKIRINKKMKMMIIHKMFNKKV